MKVALSTQVDEEVAKELRAAVVAMPYGETISGFVERALREEIKVQRAKQRREKFTSDGKRPRVGRPVSAGLLP